MKESISKRKELKEHTMFSSTRDDIISKLPDSLISQILLYLPTKEAIRTSVLSNRWKTLWLLIPGLDLNSREFPDDDEFVSFMNKYLDISREEKSCLQKLKLSMREDMCDPLCLNSLPRWIEFFSTRKLMHLDAECHHDEARDFLVVMPLSLYICETLVYLRLQRVELARFESVSLPRLKTMCLEHNIYANEACLESLISSCPVLEDLRIVRTPDDNGMFLRVHSQTLTSLSVELGFHELGENFLQRRVFNLGNSGLLIDAPRLKYLSFKDETSKSKILTNVGSFAKFITNFYLNQKPLPQFCNLSCLEVQCRSPILKSLSTFLHSCPKLKPIILDLYPSRFKTRISSCSPVPQCLLSSLEFVEIKSRFLGHIDELLVAKYFVENSVFLKKLLVHLSSSEHNKNLAILRDLRALRRSSRICQIAYVTDC